MYWKERYWRETAVIFRIFKECLFTILPADDSLGMEQIVFTNDELERLAEKVHEQWCRERLADGWVYGSKRDVDKKEHPDIVPWQDMAAHVRDWDRQRCQSWPEIFAKGGYEIRRTTSSSPLGDPQ
jgi:hypothetical protein